MHHNDCWVYMGGCSRYGCSKVRDPRVRAAVSLWDMASRLGSLVMEKKDGGIGIRLVGPNQGWCDILSIDPLNIDPFLDERRPRDHAGDGGARRAPPSPASAETDLVYARVNWGSDAQDAKYRTIPDSDEGCGGDPTNRQYNK